MIDQIRELQKKLPFELFYIELSSGRVVQISCPHEIATNENGSIGILYGNGHFRVIDAKQVVSVGTGWHQTVLDDLKKKKEMIKKMFDKEKKPDA